MQADDPIDRAAQRYAAALAGKLNLWYGNLALIVRNFAQDSSIVEHWWPATSVDPHGPRAESLRAQAAVRAFVRPAPRATEEQLTALGVALAQCSPQGAGDSPVLRACQADEAYFALTRHLSSSWQMGRADAAARELINVFASCGHRFWCGARRLHSSMVTTTIFVAAPSVERIGLIEYVGDGP